MTKCAMTNKEIRCPECGSKSVAIHYCTDYTHFYCQNMQRDPEKQCHSIGMYCFKSYPHYDPKYPEIIRKDLWIHGIHGNDDSIEFTLENYKKQMDKEKKEREDNQVRFNKHFAEDHEDEEDDDQIEG